MLHFMVNLIFISLISTFYYTKNPVFLAFSLLGLSFVVFSYLTVSLNSWIGLAIILIFSGGMMIIFLYMTSLSSGGKMVFNHSKMVVAVGLCFMLNFEMSGFLWEDYSFESFPMIYYSGNMGSIVFIMAYILLALFLAVEIAQTFHGALIKKITS